MKYAWIEEVEIGQGDEILDGEGQPFDPPMYEEISIGTGNGVVTGLNRGAGAGEQEGTMTPQQLVWGMVSEYYKVVAEQFTPKSQEDIDELSLETERQSALDRLWAEMDSIIASHGVTEPVTQSKKESKLTKALRKESKGQASQKDIDLLDDNDVLDEWFDDMETAAEDQGETWIEAPERTEAELKAFDPAVDVIWPVYPF